MLEEKTIPAVFQNRTGKFGEKACVGYKAKDGRYHDISWNDMNTMVKNLGLFLISKGIKIGDKVALFSPNRYEWWVADLAILSIGGVNVPIYATDSAAEARYIISNSDSRLCFVASQEHLDKVLEVRDQLKNLEEIVIFDHLEDKVPGVTIVIEAIDEGKRYKEQGEFDRRLNAIRPSDLATIIYTSGTTGNPKGVMLTHDNLAQNVHQCYSVAPEIFDEEQIFLSFLPLAHCFERTGGYYLPLWTGNKVVFAQSFDTLQENLQEVRPTFLMSVPRLYEKIHAGVLAKVAQAPPVKKTLFTWAMGIAQKNLPYICDNKQRKGFFAFQYILADRLIFSKLKKALGMDRLKYAISGAAPLSVADAEFFLGIGIKIIEAYGLTETTPAATVNKPESIKIGSVGLPVVDTLVKIGEGGEVLIKGPQVMKGYYKNEKATREVFTADGFFRTGDIGEIDEKGYLRITGRIKELIITAGGKNISPQNIENSLKNSAFIEQVAVLGDNRKYLSALIVPAFEELENWAKENNILFSNRTALVSNNDVVQLYEHEIDLHTKDFAQVEHIRKFTLMDHEWSQQSDELTPTLKVKRRVINSKYADTIERMYSV
jgi:long-chain acyl-CoA synthetase